jgi:transcriptional regulator with XRE-family HTH domain
MQADLGARLGVTGSQLNKLETGVNQPMLAIALAIAEAMGLLLSKFILGRDGDPSRRKVARRST